MPPFDDDSFDEYDEYPEYYDNVHDSGMDFWDYIPGTQFLDAEESQTAFDLFYEGFMVENGDREAFFEYMGMEEDDFPWEDWREFMGY